MGDVIIAVYLDTGSVLSYTIKNCSSSRAKEHISAISKAGYDRIGDGGCLEHFPSHRILKIKASGITFDPMYVENSNKVA